MIDTLSALEKSLPDLSHLTEDERKKILSVLSRDDILQKKQAEQISLLRHEIDILESKSIDLPSEHVKSATICVRCKQSFGYFYFYNQGDFCPKCKYKVCQKCQVFQLDLTTKWLCILCHKYNDLNQYLVKTGQWIHTDIAKPNLRRDSLSSSQVIKLALQPDKKDQILKEINNATKSSLARKASVLRNKAKSSNGFNPKHLAASDLTPINQANSNHSLSSLNASSLIENTSQSPSNFSFTAPRNKSIVDLKKFSTSIITEPVLPSPKKNFDLYKQPSQKSILSKQSSFVDANNNEKTPRNAVDKHFQFANEDACVEKEKPGVKIASRNDIDSITSSDMDSESLNSVIKSPLYDRRRKNPVEDLEDQSTNEGLDKGDSVSKVSKGSNKSSYLEADDTFLQMDQIFAQVKETIKISNQNSTNSIESTNQKDSYQKQIFLQTDHVTQTIASPTPNELNKIETEPPRIKNRTLSLMRRSSKKSLKFERANSVRSVNQDFDLDASNIKGRIHLTLDYDKKSSNLNVKIIECDGLDDTVPKKLDVYVKLYLIPGDKDKNNKRKTSVKKGTASPEFNETLRYILSHLELGKNKLWVSVWHSDKFGRNKFLGEVWIQLEPDIMLKTSNPPKWYELKKRRYFLNENVALHNVFSRHDDDTLSSSRDIFCK